MNYKFHYVYRITNKITNMYYYGDRSCNCHPSEDIGIKYFSTSTLKFFIKDQKINPQDYKYKVIKIFETCREDAKQLEVDLHKKFDVKNHPKFINRANQTSMGFMNNTSIHKKGVNIRLKSNSYKTGAVKASNTWQHKSEEDKLLHSKKMSVAFSKIDTFKRSLKSLEKRKENNNMPNGSKNGRAQIIHIYDSNNNLKFECNGNFWSMCEEFNLPSKALQKSYTNKGKKIYPGRIQKIVIDKGFDVYVGWYALKFS